MKRFQIAAIVVVCLGMLAAAPGPRATGPKPVLILVSAEWCGYCHSLQRTLLAMRDQGKLGDCLLCVCDYDANRALAEALMRGGGTSVPQLVLLQPAGRLVGDQSEAQILQLLNQPPAPKGKP